ncbi:MgtC/SapB family protein [Mangrovibrevibacter kandeliae]|uniref:MgtC/SapB family protein n=1 Tax=Mangrovibrevibacter kandeliae TaxID=2968473 RepID=UPI0021182F85|nr:MgtC/SapB family protein [Aurantimonas sp. CSK15Z-1]MCQ8783931.1 MgtC/SapB family protein [Aurantimonas sp. CSK15Z-1]
MLDHLGLDASLLLATLDLVCAVILSGAIGFEREMKGHAAGLRTHMMVGAGACLFTLLLGEVVATYSTGAVRADPARIISAVTSGVAFLAAGAIIKSGDDVRGLTTGASLWMAGAIGLGCGLGKVALASVALIVTLAVLRCVNWFERWLENRK